MAGKFQFLKKPMDKYADFIKNILICVPKMNEGLKGLEQHEGE